MRSQLLGVDQAAEATVDYMAFIRRFKLVEPSLESLYGLREHLLALMYKVDTEGVGTLTLRELTTVCKVLHRQFEAAAELCASSNDLLRALGPVGEKALATGTLSIAEVAAQFQVRVPDGSTPPSLVELLHRLDRDDLKAVAHSASSPQPNNSRRSRTTSSCESSSAQSTSSAFSDGLTSNLRVSSPEPLRSNQLVSSSSFKNSSLVGLVVDDPELALPPIVGGRDSGTDREVSLHVSGEDSADGCVERMDEDDGRW
mmetsp:Transcript_62761/g.104468  ORF Transcript_62761/g.104468 Transcript_62761/m.104468 type:complete len:257 (-) Transcript_62761:519-1289(-)